MTLEEVISVMERAEAEGKMTVRLTPAIHVSMVRSVSRWISWMKRIPMIPARVSVPSAELHLH